MYLEEQEEFTLKDQIQIWLEDNKEYSLSRRIAFIPDEVVSKLYWMTVYEANKYLDREGY